MNISDRKGVVEVSRKLLDEYTVSFDEQNPLFKDFVPMKIDYDYLTDTLKFYGCSKHFRVLFPGEMLPTYQVNVTTVEQSIIQTSVKYREITKF